MNYNRIVMLAFFLLALALCTNGQLFTKYSVKTELSTFTRTILTSTICVKLAVNPMPVCRRRKHLYIEEPIYWSAPPDGQQFIQPTNVFQVEPTAVPWFSRDVQHSGFDENWHWNNLLAQHASIQPSLTMPVSDLFYKRIPFESVPMANGAAEDNWAQNRQRKTVIVLTFTKPTTQLETTTKTNTIAISGCTPSPFPYDVCV